MERKTVNDQLEREFGYKKVKIFLTTHSKGKITDLDFKLAEKIDQITI